MIAIDASGQQGWDQTPIILPTSTVTGNIQITSSYVGKTFIGSHATPREIWSGSSNGGSQKATCSWNPTVGFSPP